MSNLCGRRKISKQCREDSKLMEMGVWSFGQWAVGKNRIDLHMSTHGCAQIIGSFILRTPYMAGEPCYGDRHGEHSSFCSTKPVFSLSGRLVTHSFILLIWMESHCIAEPGVSLLSAAIIDMHCHTVLSFSAIDLKISPDHSSCWSPPGGASGTLQLTMPFSELQSSVICSQSWSKKEFFILSRDILL